MHEIFLPIGQAYFDAWRCHRLFSACRSFAQHLDPNMTAQAVYRDYERLGWTFHLTTIEARDRLAAFHDGLRGKVIAEEPSRHHPVEVGGYDAVSAIYPR